MRDVAISRVGADDHIGPLHNDMRYTEKCRDTRPRVSAYGRAGLAPCGAPVPQFLETVSSRPNVSERRDLRTEYLHGSYGNAKILRRASLAQDDAAFLRSHGTAGASPRPTVHATFCIRSPAGGETPPLRYGGGGGPYKEIATSRKRSSQ